MIISPHPQGTAALWHLLRETPLTGEQIEALRGFIANSLVIRETDVITWLRSLR